MATASAIGGLAWGRFPRTLTAPLKRSNGVLLTNDSQVHTAFHCGLDERNPESASCSDKHELSLVDVVDLPGRMQPNTIDPHI